MQFLQENCRQESQVSFHASELLFCLLLQDLVLLFLLFYVVYCSVFYFSLSPSGLLFWRGMLLCWHAVCWCPVIFQCCCWNAGFLPDFFTCLMSEDVLSLFYVVLTITYADVLLSCQRCAISYQFTLSNNNLFQPCPCSVSVLVGAEPVLAAAPPSPGMFTLHCCWYWQLLAGLLNREQIVLCSVQQRAAG